MAFGDVVKEIRQSTKDPIADGIECVVGLEHIEPECIHLRNWASIDEATTFTKTFQKGHILFGRRRAYLKKAARTEFDGICSGDITVMESKDGLIPELLPFLICNDKFFDYAVKHSAGGLSPRTKFKDLANYEFFLPPKDQQTNLAELFWASDRSCEENQRLARRIERHIQSLFKHANFVKSTTLDPHFGKLRSKHPVAKAGDHITQLQYGISESLTESEGIPVLRMNNLQNGVLDLRDLKYFPASPEDLEDVILNKGDVLFNRTNSFDLVGKVSLFDVEGTYTFASYLIRIKTDERTLDPRYLNFFFNTELGKAKIRRYRTPGVSQSNINAQNIRQIRIPLPPISEQRSLMDKVDSEQALLETAVQAVQNAKQLQKSLINQIF
ncbi:MAG: restriction endonuclease subunit S [Verrucomicrobiales bacterium]|nr:restriction endonuclease subunit S [Verrucomicrobiales bacterium]